MANKIMEYVMNTPENTNPAVLKSLVKELLTVKKLKDISVRELLSIEDGFYKLETPVAYEANGEGDRKELFSVECPLNYWDDSDIGNISFFNEQITVQPVVGDNYHVKLKFSSGLVVEKDIECTEVKSGPRDTDVMTMICFDDSMFDNLASLSGIAFTGEHGISGGIKLTTPQDQNKVKYGDHVVIAVAEVGKTTTGEISGVISVSTDTKILDGVTKVITALADDTSYYVNNIWQDGDALEVSAMDETSGGGEDKRNIIDLSYTIDTANNTITLDDWSHVGSLIREGNGLTITINEEFASMVSGTKTGDVYVVVNTDFYEEDDQLTNVYAYLAPLPYFSPLYTDNRRGELQFNISGLIFSEH